MPLSTGQILNQRYRIVKLLGQGGFGAVYRAWDVNFQLPCALKENFDTSPEAQRQFQREAQILHTLRHPGLPLVKDYFIVPGQGQYLIMDYIEGEDLQARMTRLDQPLPVQQVIHWLVQVCEALVYMQNQTPPVIHRDIKPANIKITGETGDAPGRAILVDFGIAKIYQPGAPTTQGARAVSPGYAPFEQYGHAPTDARTDIYALGALAFALLTGQTPTESIARMAGSELPSPRSLTPAIPVEVEKVILKALEQMPADRYQKAQDLLDELRKIETQLPAQETRLPNVQPISDLSTSPVHMTSEQVAVAGGTAAPVVQARPAVETTPDTGLQAIPAQPPVASAVKPRKKRRGWIWVALVGVMLLVGVGAGGYLSGWFGTGFAPVGNGMQGVWFGRIMSPGGDHGLRLEIEAPPEARSFSGLLELTYPDGRLERFPLDGMIDANGFRLHDLREGNGLYLWGSMEGNRLVGQAAWGCYFCDAWGEFEVTRQ
jgi:hypothetical protein